MSDRFNFLEFGDDQPAAPVETPSVPVSDTGWKPLRLKAVELIGEPGTGSGQFATPMGLAVDPYGSLYVADSNNHRIQRITSSGDVYVYGRPGNAAGQLWKPQAVAVDPSGQFFYVAEAGNNRIQKFLLTGQPQGTVGGFQMPSGVVCDNEGRLWIADTGNSRILAMDIKSGKFTAGLDKAAGLAYPLSVCTRPGGGVYVTDGSVSDVWGFDARGYRVSSLAQNRRLNAPRQVGVDAQGRLYLAESGANRLHVFEANGDSLLTFDTPSTKLGPFKTPSGIAIGPTGDIYVADTLNHRVLRLVWE